MSNLVTELRDIQKELQTFIDPAEEPSTNGPIINLTNSANLVGKAWSGSWIGYQSKIYYKNLELPPPGTHYSSEWGGRGDEWVEFDSDWVQKEIYRKAGNPNLEPAREIAKKGSAFFEEKHDQIISILEIVKSRRDDPFINKLLEEVNKLTLITAERYVSYARPSGRIVSRDAMAISQGLWTPPHIAVLADTISLLSPSAESKNLAKIAQKAASHLERLESAQMATEKRLGTKIFIGHGRSPVWKDLKDFIQDRLHLPWDEFNRIPVAGITNIDRLSAMLDSSAMAFIIMTAEDEQPDGQVRARMNVIHEAGLFQGRLGFTKAILLLEEGCEEFSNVQGLGQIRFPKGNINAASEDVRRVLEREGILNTDETK